MMNGSELLRILSFSDVPLRLKDLVEIISLSLFKGTQTYCDSRSMKISICLTLGSLTKKGLISKTKKYDGEYHITELGLRVLSEIEIAEALRTTALERKLNKDRLSHAHEH